jgi:hypothetical protein
VGDGVEVDPEELVELAALESVEVGPSVWVGLAFFFVVGPGSAVVSLGFGLGFCVGSVGCEDGSGV